MPLPLWADAPARAETKRAASGVRLRRVDDLELIALLDMLNIYSANYSTISRTWCRPVRDLPVPLTRSFNYICSMGPSPDINCIVKT